MPPPPPPTPHFIHILCFFCLLCNVKADDLQILLKLKTALQNSNTDDVFKSWTSSTSVCHFTGVACSSDGSVREIELSNQKLSGSIPFDSICQLPELEKLSLGFNFLYGTIAVDLNNCVKLKYLDLGNNLLSGTIPNISSLSKLEYLYLNTSGFSGTFPWKSLTNMTSLIRLSIGDNPFNRSNFPNEVLNLKKLNWLYLSNCSLEGEIPAAIGNLTELINLELSDNYLTGSLPAELGNLRNLWQLELYNNLLNETLPVGLRNLTRLENFDASTNFLEGDLSELRFLTNLVSLQLFENLLTGHIPAEFGEFKRLTNLSLYTNQLTGPLPQSLGSWANFDFIDVSENFLTGEIPPDMCKMGTMKSLLILQNNFTGQIPASYGNCTTLRRFRVRNNSLSGVVPAKIWGLPNLNIIDLELNQLEGPITSDIQYAVSLAQLFAANNHLNGNLPAEISKTTSLVAIDLSFNQFYGEIPTLIGSLNRLGNLHLQSNKFSGSIPESIGSCTSLSDLNLGQNSLSGEIPPSLGSLPSLNSLNLSQNELSGQIPKSLSSLKLSLLDLSNNRLTGLIPQSLSIAAYNGSFAGNPGLCSMEVSSFHRCSVGPGLPRSIRTLVICLVLGSVLLMMSLVLFLYLRKIEKDRERDPDRDRSLKEDSWDLKSFHVLTFTEDEILDSIKEENLIGRGGSGNVYRVTVDNSKELAVKHIWNTDLKPQKGSKSKPPILPKRGSKSKEFDAEVETLSSIRHVNVVKLYCSITSEDSSLLVYEYMPNGSLWDRLHGSMKMVLDWETRYEIAVGAAKGLEYLHHGCERPVIHRDVKSSNILLDEFLKPRIADFGLAKIVQTSNVFKDSSHIIAGTLGYIAPEYGYTSKVNEKSDVYSFGVVLMELVSGKRPIEPEFGDNKDIVNWVSSNLKSKDSVFSIVDSRIPDGLKEGAIKVLRIAILCTARLPTKRPTMRSVVKMIKDADPCRIVSIVISKDQRLSNFKKLDS